MMTIERTEQIVKLGEQLFKRITYSNDPKIYWYDMNRVLIEGQMPESLEKEYNNALRQIVINGVITNFEGPRPYNHTISTL